jgi:hypothetical protein
MSAPLFNESCRWALKPAKIPLWRWPQRLFGSAPMDSHRNLVVEADGFVALHGWGPALGRRDPIGNGADLVFHARPTPSRVQLRTPAGDLWTFQFQGPLPEASTDRLLHTLARLQGDTRRRTESPR